MQSQKINSRKDAILDRGEIEALIADGRKLVIVDGIVLKVDAWLPYHPGGDTAVLHMIGRDASNEFKAFHSAETQQLMFRYQIGKVHGHWRDFTPPIQGGVFRTEEEQRMSKEGTVHIDVKEIVPDDQSSESASDYAISDTSENMLDSCSTNASSIDEAITTTKETWTAEGRTQQELQHDLDRFPSLDSDTQENIIFEYTRLDQKLRARGLYDCNYSAYAFESIRYLTLGSLSYWFLQNGWYAVSAAFLGMMWHQLVFTVHDAGHMGITHNYQFDSCLAIFIANFIGGLSCCWWKRAHNVHHIVTNSAEHDPDIQHMPFFAISHRFFDDLKSSFNDRIMTYDAAAKMVLEYQHFLYYPVLMFGRFNLYALSWHHIIFNPGPRKGAAWWHRYLELTGQIFFWYWFGYLVLYKSIPTWFGRVVFVLVSHMLQAPLHVQLTLSHFAMSTTDLGVAESFPQRMLRTTMDVQCPEWLDFIHGGLQFQVVHHLFPRMPRHNLRQAHKLVLEYCDKVNIPYTTYGFVEGNEKVVGRLADIAHQAHLFAECQRSIAITDILDGH